MLDDINVYLLLSVLHVIFSRALDEGLCGLPSFQVNNGPVVWGQDRMDVVADMLCGWQDLPQSKL